MSDKLQTFRSYLDRLKIDVGDTLEHFDNLTTDQATEVCDTVGVNGLASALQYVQRLHAAVLQKEADVAPEVERTRLQQDADKVTDYLNQLQEEKRCFEQSESTYEDVDEPSGYETGHYVDDLYSEQSTEAEIGEYKIPSDRFDEDDDEIELDSDVECSEMELPTLLTQIRKILDEYPDDGQIIKELVQNADDAKASEMKILYDGRMLQGSPKTTNRYNKFFKGPALVVYNDGEFTNEDWTGIKRVYNSVKADDPLRVGRFGLGFKSVFHITDYPCIISGEKILFMNPLSKNSSQVCVTISLKKLERIKRLNIDDCLTAFEGIFGFDKETMRSGHFRGTLFRFPLRQEESSLSTNLYDDTKILDLFRALHSDSNRNMLFLRCVQSLSLFIDLPSTSMASSLPRQEQETSSLYDLSVEQINFGAQKPFYTVNIQEKNKQAVAHKAHFEETLRKTGLDIADEPSYFTSHATVHTMLSLTDGSNKQVGVDWLIINYLHGGEVSDELRNLLQDDTLGYLPVAGIAGKLHHGEGLGEEEEAGAIFCYQPLPQDKDSHTGLPVHVNAYFALTQNRRHVKWPTDEQELHHMHTDSAIRWNKTIISEILPQAYALFVKEVTEFCQREGNTPKLVQTVYDKFPDLSKTAQRWHIVSEKTIQIVQGMNLPLLFTHNTGGRWITAIQATLSSFTPDDTENMDVANMIIRLLLEDNVNVVCAPDHVTSIGNGSRVVSPTLLRDHLMSHNTYMKLERNEKLCILTYICQNNNIQDLAQIALVPLQNGEFTSLEKRAEVFVSDEDVIRLFPGQEAAFLATDVPNPVGKFFKQFADSGESCLRKLDAEKTAELISRTFTSHFEKTNPINIDQSKYSYWEGWLTQIWKHLYENHEHDFDHFLHLPLMPVQMDKNNTNNYVCLHPLTDKLILKKRDGSDPLQDQVCEALRCFSITVFEKPLWIQMNLSQYLYDTSNTRMLKIFVNINETEIDRFNTNLTEQVRKMFFKFLLENLRSISEDARRKLVKLVMFDQFVSNESSSNMTCIEDRKEVYQEKEFPIKFPHPVIKVSPTECEFAVKLGAQEITQEGLIMKTFEMLHLYNKEEQKIFVLWLLKSNLWKMNEKTSDFLQSLAYLQASDGQLYSPRELFDPSDDRLSRLFMFEAKFPTDTDFLAEDCLMALRKLGLKQEDSVSTSDIEVSCKLIDSQSAQGNKQICYKALAVMELLEKRIDLLKYTDLHELRFIPVLKERPSSYPSCLPHKSKMCAITETPSCVTASGHCKLIGSVLATVECQAFPQLAEHYGWNKTPSLENILHHLHNLSKSYTSQDKPEVMSLVTEIYTVLSQTYKFEDTKKLLKEIFTDKKFIWYGDGFDIPECLFTESTSDDLDLKPFLRPIPSELKHLKDFFHDLECFGHVKAEAYLFVLKQLKENGDHGNYPTSKVLMRNISVSILNTLQNNYLDDPLCKSKVIYVPIETRDDSLHFKAASECVYCDASWLKEELDENEEEDEELYFSHKDVPLATAQALGIPSLSKKVFADSDAMEEWGQEEPLTRRLKHILEEGYLDGFSIPKELFQNADDAGATKMWMMYDERENEDCKKNLLSSGMSEWQGPALWVYNDAKFTEKDFNNLTKLSGATKESDPCTIGKFGLGFCAVYNLTDVPSLISGENIVIFDPHMKYLGNALPGKSPGLRLNLTKIRSPALKKKVCNQFRSAENIFGCQNIASKGFHFEGTLFRFPLRRNHDSDISDILYTRDKMKEFLDMVYNSMPNLMLFNFHINEFKVFHLEHGSPPSNACILFETSKIKEIISVENLSPHSGSILNEIKDRKIAKTLGSNQLRMLEKVTIHVNNNVLCEKIDSIWFISWATGTDNDTLRISLEENGTVPIAAIAVPFENGADCLNPISLNDVQNGFYKNGHYFVFLPVPINHNYPFHINASFAVTNDRRSMKAKTGDDNEDRYDNWNQLLLGDSVVESLIYFLENMRKICNIDAYQLWPLQQPEDSIADILRLSFYKKIISSCGIKIFASRNAFVDISECIFLETSLKDGQFGSYLVELLVKSKYGNNFVDLPSQLYKLVEHADEEVVHKKTIQKSTFIVECLIPKFSVMVDMFSEETRDQLTKFSINVEDSTVLEYIKQTKCIPTKPNGKLCLIEEVVDCNSNIACLYEELDERFPCDGFLDMTTREKLLQLGMLHDVVKNSDVLNRIQSIPNLTEQCFYCGFERCCTILDYLEENFENHQDILEDVCDINFLPVLPQPCSWYKTTCEDQQACTCQRHQNVARLSHNIHTYDLREIKVTEAYQQKEKVWSPKQMSSHEYANLIGSVVPMIDCKSIPKLADAFGWLENPKTDLVIKHIINIVTNYQSSLKAKFLPMIIQVYEFLSGLSNISEVKEIMEEVFKNQHFCFVWSGDGFVSASTVFVEQQQQDIDLKPYLLPLPSELSHLKDFFLSLGCFNTIDLQAYLNVLEQLKDSCEKKENKMNPTSIISLAVTILNKLVHDHQDIIQQSAYTIYVPVQSENESDVLFGKLKECVYCDSDRMMDQEVDEDDQDLLKTHKAIPVSTVKGLGIPSMTQKLFSNSDAMEEWGQEEPLTRRLKHILEESYVDGFSIPKELFQNADDAGATKMWMMYDERENEDCKKNLLSSGMSEWQGPALWVYNDAKFTEKDFNNLTKLSGATKESDPCTIGKFGLGFCAVYNLTDVPSLISGENIVIFDPHMKYLGNALPGKSPGLRINVSKIRHGTFEKKVCNQFKPAEGVFGCKLFSDSRQSFEGTLFRFPLRSKPSDISSKPYTNQEMDTLVKITIECASNLLLFNMNVEEIKLFHLQKQELDPNNARLIFETRKDVQSLVSGNLSLGNSILNEASHRKNRKTLECSQLKAVDSVTISRNLFESTQENNQTVTKWLVSWTTGIQKPTLDLSYEKSGAIPVSSVAVPYTIDNGLYCIEDLKNLQSGFYKESHFYCFLPLPIKHTLPYHINCPFLVSSDRRSLSISTEDDSIDSSKNWNECLLNDCVVEAILLLLETLVQLKLPHGYQSFSLWPLCTSDELLIKMVTKFYDKIVTDNDHRPFKHDEAWYNISMCRFMEFELKGNKYLGDFAFQIFSNYLKDGVACSIPDTYYSNLLTANRERVLRQTITKEDFIVSVFFQHLHEVKDNYSSDLVTELIKYAIYLNHSMVDEKMKEIECIPSKPNGNLKYIQTTVDHECAIANLYDESDECFIIESFCEERTRERLKKVGMMFERITNEDVKQRVLSIQRIHDACSHCAIERCFYLLMYLENQFEYHRDILQELKHNSFLPALHFGISDNRNAVTLLCKKHTSAKYDMSRSVVSFENNIFLKGDNQEIYTNLVSPASALSLKYKTIVGSVMPVVQCSQIENIAEEFGWMSLPDIENVVHHLRNVTKEFENSSKSISLEMVTDVYRYLKGYKDFNVVKETLNDVFADMQNKYVWFGDGFVSPKEIVLKQSEDEIDLKPYLRPLPSELAESTPFFESLGCFTSIDAEVYLKILEDIKESTEQDEPNFNVSTVRRITVNILNKLKSKYLESVRLSQRPAYFPVHTSGNTLILKKSDECVFCDSQWLNESEIFDEEDDLMFVHGDISNSTAEALGVLSLTDKVFTSADAMEDWGQEEPLTTRLRTIISESYVDGFSIAKELFQNADDAGATKMWIMYDKRQNETLKTNLLDEEMARWQGPAIWVYNDAEFTEEDFNNITKLNGATKEYDSCKIGKFGLGFCAVYNITDLPSFISGENIVIFDPHMKHLGKVRQGQSPGLRINVSKIKNKGMLSKINSQFQPYENVFGCKLVAKEKASFHGTLFRLPLRNQTSDISEKVCTDNDIMRLLEKTINSAANMFLFNMHVKEMKIYLLDENETDPTNAKLLFDSYKEVENVVTANSIPIQTESLLFEVTKRKQSASLDKDPIKVLQQVHVTREDFTCDEKSTVSWIVAWATGQNPETLRLTYKENGAVPLGSVAVPYKMENGILNLCQIHDLPTGFYDSPHFFFFLPLPIEHKFPFHINGQFSVSFDRRRLRSMSDDDFETKHEEWNRCLLGDSTVESFVYLLQMMKHLETSKLYRFYDLWPLFGEGQMYNVVPEKFYHKMINQNIQIFIVEKQGLHEWLDISACSFLDPDLQKSQNKQKPVFDDQEIRMYAFSVFKTFLDGHAIDLPLCYHQCLEQTNIELMHSKTVNAEMFIISYLLPNISDLRDCINTSERNLLLKFSLMMSSNVVDIKLKDTPCIPTADSDESLRQIRDTVDPEAFFSALFVMEDARFPVEGFLKFDVKSRLKELGMMYDQLPDNIIVEKARSVSHLQQTCIDCARERCEIILNYLKKKGLQDLGTYALLQHCQFLPVQGKPQNWPAEWGVSNVEIDSLETLCGRHGPSILVPGLLRKPVDIFKQKCKNLVGCIFPITELSIIEDAADLATKLGIRDTKDDAEATDIVIKNLLKFVSTADLNESEDIATIVRCMYIYLNAKCDISSNQMLILKSLGDQHVIWVGGFFAKSKNVALEEQKDCPPYIYTLKENYIINCGKLCKSLQIKTFFDPKMIALELNALAISFGVEPLGEDILGRSLTLLEVLFDCMKRDKIRMDQLFDKETLHAVYIPDEDCILRKSTTLCFNDYDGLEKSDTMVYVHDRVSPKVAKTFRVKPKTIQNLEDISDDIEDFYQEEPLTTRIKNLLEGYPCDASVFKEMLQNADDAGASEVHILFDTLSHPSNNVFDQRFKPLQGPAVLIYNNKCFTADDLQGIQNLGNSTKRGDPSKTGKYGVGFNAVYNITDVPSFLTFGSQIENGETLCFFDPNAKYIPNVSHKRPGKRYKNTRSIYDHHSNVIQGYHKSDLSQNDEGTIFRLPLRSESMSKTSKIKDNPISKDDVSRMLYELQSELQNMLIFLKKLKKVSVSSCVKGNVVTEYTVECGLSPEDEIKRDKFFQHFMQTAKDVKSQNKMILDVEQITTDYTVTVYENGSQIVSYHIVQKFGFGKEIPTLLKENMANGNIQLLPYGGVALQLKGGKAHTIGKNKSKVFCFLPLPIDTGLPVNIQGFFALSDETRRSLWRSNEQKCYKTLWNMSIIENVITPAYIELLHIMKSRLIRKFDKKSPKASYFDREAQSFFAAFPCMNYTEDFYWKHLAKCVCHHLVQENISFMPILHHNPDNQKANLERITWSSVYTDSHEFPAFVQVEQEGPEFFKSSPVSSRLRPVGGKIYTRYAVLKKLGMKIVSLPDRIKKAFKDAGVGIPELTVVDTIDFLCSSKSVFEDSCRISINVPVTESPVRNIENCSNILKYCETNNHVYCKFRYIPILVSQEGNLKQIENSFLYDTKYSTFFKDKLDLFLHSSLRWLFQRSKSDGALREFTVEEFVLHLKDSEYRFLTEGPVSDWQNDSPTSSWITDFWDFFWSDVDLQNKNSKDIRPELIEEKLSVINNVSLLPVVEYLSMTETIVNLMPVAEFGSLIYTESFKGRQLRSAISKMLISELSTECFQDTKYMGYLLQQLPRFDCPEKILDSFMNNLEKVKMSELSNEECISLLEYLLQGLDTATLKQKMDLIRQLPLFITHDGQRVDIASFKTIIVVPDSLPGGLDFLTEQKEIALLKGFDTYIRFERELLFQKMSISDLYTRHVLPNHHRIECAVFYKHVYFICKLYRKQDFNENVVSNLMSVLSRIPFIKTKNGTFTVSNFFSSHNQVFKTFCNDSEFLPEKFRKTNCLSFFSKLGLITSMNAMLFERFASETAELQRSDKTLVEKSKILAQSLASMPTDFFTSSNLDMLSEIEFLLPEEIDKRLLDLCPQYPNQRICYARSILPSKTELCWTTTSVLPKYALPLPQNDQFCKTLRVFIYPETKHFVAHCKNVGNSINMKISEGKRVDCDAMKKLMGVLYSEMERLLSIGNLDHINLELLKETPIVFFPKKREIHLASSVVIECDRAEEIPPYLNKCPPDFMQYSEVFLQLGAFNRPNIDCYVMVLSCVKHKCGGKQMLPNEKDLIKHAIKNLVEVLKHLKDTTDQCHDIFIPSDKWRMEKSDTMVLCNNKYLKKRLGKKIALKFFVGFEMFGVKEDIGIEMFLKLATTTRPQLLTDLIGEEIMLDDIKFQDNDHSRQLELYLRSDVFAGGVLRLAKHAFRVIQSKWTIEDEKVCLSLLKGIRVRNVVSMKTILTLKTENRKHIEGTTSPKSVHIQQDQDSLKVYISTMGKKWFNDFKKEFAVHLNGALKSCFKDRNFVLLVEIIESKDCPESISELLDKNHIDHHSFVQETPHAIFPKPGNYVPEEFHKYLDNTVGIIHEYDYKYIAYEVEDPLVEDNSESTPTYVYAEIKRRIGTDSNIPLLQMYEVDIGEEDLVTVPAFKLYVFLRKETETEEVVQFEGEETSNENIEGASASDTNTSSSRQQTMKEVRKEIRELLMEAWKKGEKERKHIVKRLMLKWHPDKNPTDVTFCTKVFQFIQQCLRLLENGTTLSAEDDSDDEDGKSKGTHSSGFRSDGFYWDTFFDSFNRRSSNNRRRNRGRHSGFGFGGSFFDSDEWSRPFVYTREAKRWQRHAQCDLGSAQECFRGHPNPAYNWICYKCHQAVEKALKAAWYAKDANRVRSFKYSHNLADISIGLPSDIRSLVRSLLAITGASRKMRYPSEHGGEYIPVDHYSRHDAEESCSVAEELLEKVANTYSL